MRPVTERAQTWMVSGETLRNVKWKTELESKRAEVNQYIACHIQKRFSKWWQLKVKKMHVFYRCNQSPYLTHIHCSSRMTPGLTQGLGGSGDNFWQMKTSPSPPRRAEQQQAHPEDCCACWRVLAVPSQETPLLLTSIDSASANAFKMQWICHLLPNSSPGCGTSPASSQTTLETGWYRGYRLTIQLPVLRIGLQSRTLAVLGKFMVSWAEGDVTNMFRKDQKKMSALFFYLSF